MRQRWNLARLPRLDGKRAIVTGANSGLGLETAAGLASAGASVIMACRNPLKSEAALQSLKQRAPGAIIEPMALDLADLTSVQNFVASYATRHPSLDILVNNAGVMHLPYQKTRDGFEMQVGVNHLGHFALTAKLMPLLEAAPAARVVTVSSLSQRMARPDLDDLNWERRPYNSAAAYAHSKMANLMFHVELDRRLRHSGRRTISVAAHPGFAATNIGFGEGDRTGWLKRLLINTANKTFAQSARQGALPSLYAAGSPDARAGDYIGPDGLLQFYGYPVSVGIGAAARDPGRTAGLWQRSEQLTGMPFVV
jgi:NAD(P)-dependent dehydrogenase (short-subunit alcohol dehydrogenase family)